MLVDFVELKLKIYNTWSKNCFEIIKGEFCQNNMVECNIE